MKIGPFETGAVHLCDCLDGMKALPENSIDTIITDPPYGLEFMGKDWDKFLPEKARHSEWDGRRRDDTANKWDKAGRDTKDPQAFGPGYSVASHYRPNKKCRICGKWQYDKDPCRCESPEWIYRVREEAPAQRLGYQGWCNTWAAAALRVAKPGALLLAFGGTRTFHRLACAIEDAGWEIRDTVMWVYGSGFPKSCSISKQLDKQVQNTWLKVAKAVDGLDQTDIIEAWKEYSKNAKSAGLRFAKSRTEIGMSTPKNDSAPGHVLLRANQERSDANAVIAELNSIEAPRIAEVGSFTAQDNADTTILPSMSDAHGVESQRQFPEAESPGSIIVPVNVKDWQNEKTAVNLKAVEALKIWLGSRPSSKRENTDALSAALIDDLKRIILSRSKTFRHSDTSFQTDCVSAINVTITESTAVSLISFTVDTLKNEAIDKAAGAEREVVGRKTEGRYKHGLSEQAKRPQGAVPHEYSKGWVGDPAEITAPATEAAKRWEGWGTALKPAWEPVLVAMKPLDGTFAENACKHGVAGLNIDGGRVGAAPQDDYGRSAANADGTVNAHDGFEGKAFKIAERDGEYAHEKGRWPANLIHDGSEKVTELFPEQSSGGTPPSRKSDKFGTAYGEFKGAAAETGIGGSAGSAARFFYCAKASRRERHVGLPEPGLKVKHGATPQDCETADWGGNHHPTVKPLELMRYLVRLTKTPTGGVVLDLFSGSGTTGMACRIEGREFIGFEKDEAYTEIANKRIHAAFAALEPDPGERKPIKDMPGQGLLFEDVK